MTDTCASVILHSKGPSCAENIHYQQRSKTKLEVGIARQSVQELKPILSYAERKPSSQKNMPQRVPLCRKRSVVVFLVVASPHTARGQTGTTDTEEKSVYGSGLREKDHPPLNLQPDPLIVHVNLG